MADDPNLSELLDDDKLPAEYPPDEPTGVLEDELTVRGQQTDEPLEERAQREEPDLPNAEGTGVEPVGRLVDVDEGGADRTAQSVAAEVGSEGDGDRLDPGDIAAGDTTTRDVATERAEDMTAEEAAVNPTDDPPMGDGDGYV